MLSRDLDIKIILRSQISLTDSFTVEAVKFSNKLVKYWVSFTQI